MNLDALRLVRSVTVQLAAETSHFPLSAAFGTVTWGERTDAKTRVRGIDLAAGAGAWAIGLQAWEGTREIPAATTKPWWDVCSFGFTGREHDGSGLVYSRARYLRVEAGMWTSADPVGMPDGPARYLYARALPTLRRDPMGLFATKIHDYILTQALQGEWGASRVDILSRASADIDSLLTGQSASGSYQHAMRAPDQTVTEAEELFNAFIVDKLAGAALMWTRSQCDAADEQAIYLLGQGMHAVADQFTPLHTGFQVWYGIEPGKWVMSQYGEDLYHHFAEDDRPGDPAVMSAVHAVREYYRTFRDVVRIARLTRASQPDQFRGLAAGLLGIPMMCGIGGLTCG